MPNTDFSQFPNWIGIKKFFDDRYPYSSKFPYSKDDAESYLSAVQTIVDNKPYMPDTANYGLADKWATPEDFDLKGGDCEDYAIAKYAELLKVGWPDDLIGIVVCKALDIGEYHAILNVRVENGNFQSVMDDWILDNRRDKIVRKATVINQYEFYYSINRLWWSDLRI